MVWAWTAFLHWLSHWGPSVYRFIDHWQTLLTGFFALGAAYITVRGIQGQIANDRAIETSRRKREEAQGLREEDSARVVMPLALSELNQYASDCMRLLTELIPQPGPLAARNVFAAGIIAPRIADNVIDTLQLCARYAPQDIVDQIAGLLSMLQVQNARLRGLVSRNIGRAISVPELVNATLDAADVYARSAALYEYSRNEEMLRRVPEPDRIRNALHAVSIWEQGQPEIYAALARREERAARAADLAAGRA